METLKTKWTGVRPILMHSARLIDPDEPIVKQLKALQADKKSKGKGNEAKDESVRRQIERTEWEAALYWNSGLFMPGDNIAKCILEGARKSKAGKGVESGILPIDDTPIQTAKPHPKDLNKLYELAEYSLRQAVRIPPRTGSRIMKVRPIVPTGWVMEVTIEYDPDTVSEKVLIEAQQEAGKLVGIGNWRPKFGRFLVEQLK